MTRLIVSALVTVMMGSCTLQTPYDTYGIIHFSIHHVE